MNSKYYNNGPLLSYHCFLNFIIGHRGVGKTFSFKRWCIKDYITNKHQFMWVRRYKDETKEMKENYFNDIRDKFPDHTLEVKGGKSNGVFLIDGEIAGYYVTLSIATKHKSVPYPDVDKIIFDEFLVSKSCIHYLPNEVTALLDLMSTVFRDRDNVRGCYCIANNISMSNPYFMYFGILPFKQRFYIKGEILCENYKNQVYIDNFKKTRFGKLIAGTQYEEYAVENEALDDSDIFIGKRPDNAIFKFLVKYKGENIGFWLDNDNGYMYASREYDPCSKAKYCLTREDHEPNLYLIKNIKNTHINDLVYMFDNGLLWFSDTQVKNSCYEILSLFRK